ncbi:MAG: hypothetical protein COA45_02280 [Zetaproteobacteria bacterium]|nr:MAG: hypothetical protein COA45_02280 [Zetaproteobacteria bacterium]
MRFAIILCCMLIVNIPYVRAEPEIEGRKLNARMSTSNLNRLQRSLAQSTKSYDEVLAIIRKGSIHFDFDVGRMRGYYAKSDYYSPFSKAILDEMTEYAYIVDTSDDRDAVMDALISYKNLVWMHLVHLDVLTFSLTMSRVDERFGDEVLFADVRRSLLKAILYEGAKCEKPEMACSIVSYGEETYILGKIGGVLKNSKIYKISNQYYNVHDLVRDGQEIQVYINVTAPIVNVEKLQAVIKRGDDLHALPQ